APAAGELRVTVTGPDFDTGEIKDTTLVLSVPEGGTGADRLESFGLLLGSEGDRILLEEPPFGTPFSTKLQGFDFYADTPVIVSSVQAPSSQLPKELIFIPALLLLGLVALMQRGRSTRTEEVAA
ncbi:MAG: DUF3394 domain-containing protein, partial [Pseudomonadota bacterium]